LNLKTESLKFGLNNWVKVWKDAFAKDLHKKAKISLSDLSDHFKGLKLKLEKPAKDIDSLGHIMSALEEIRKNESSIEMEIRPIKEMYSMIEFYIADALEKEEGESKDILDKGWKELVNMGETIRNDLQKKQAKFKKSLIEGIKSLIVDVQEFRKNFEKYGPMVPGITPREALMRLRQFNEEYQVRKKKYDSYYAGETLFGLPH